MFSLTGRAHDPTTVIVLLQHVQPAFKVSGRLFVLISHDLGLSPKEGCSHFGNKLLLGIYFPAEAVMFYKAFAVEARFVPGRMDKLMEKRQIEVFRDFEGCAAWYVHCVNLPPVAGTAAASLADFRTLRHLRTELF